MSIISVDQISARLSGAAVTVSDARLDVGSNVQLDGGTGVITATSFKGSGANLTGIAVTSDINTNNIKVSGISTFGSGASTFPGAVSVTNTTTSTSTSTGALIVSGGVGIAKSLFVGENVSIGGTLTYEDVTNVDSVGVVTARLGVIATAGRGIQVTAGGLNVDAGIGTFDAGLKVPGGELTVGTAVTVGTAGIITATQFVQTVGQLSNRNLVINGAMQVAQRATTSTSTGYQTVDRFITSATGLTLTTTQHALSSSDTPYDFGFRKSIHIQNTSVGSDNAADIAGIRYQIEAQDIVSSGWNYTSSSSYITFSFWVKSSLAGTYYVQLRTKDSTNKVYAFPITVSADTWLKVEKSIPGDSSLVINNDTGAGLDINFYTFFGTDGTDSGFTINSWATFSASSRSPDFAQNFNTTNNATFEITGFQIEVGSVATPFEHRRFGDDLLACQRYYVEMGGGNYGDYAYMTGYMFNNGNNLAFGLYLPCAMRSTPTIAVTANLNVRESGSTVAANSPAIGGYDTNSNWIACSIGLVSDMGSNGDPATLTNTNNAGITLDAEL